MADLSELVKQDYDAEVEIIKETGGSLWPKWVGLAIGVGVMSDVGLLLGESFSKRDLCLANRFHCWRASKLNEGHGNDIKKIDEKTKQPFAIGLKDDSMFAFAGLWEMWKDRDTGQKLRTYTVLTTDPNEIMEPIHNRMPVILAREDYERWIAPTDPAHLPVDLLKPYPAEEMKAWKIGRAVGNTQNKIRV